MKELVRRLSMILLKQNEFQPYGNRNRKTTHWIGHYSASRFGSHSARPDLVNFHGKKKSYEIINSFIYKVSWAPSTWAPFGLLEEGTSLRSPFGTNILKMAFYFGKGLLVSSLGTLLNLNYCIILVNISI